MLKYRITRYIKISSFIIFFFLCSDLFSQNKVFYGNIKVQQSNNPISDVEIYEKNSSQLLARTNQNGYFEFLSNKKNITLVFFSIEYKTVFREINENDSSKLDIYLEPLTIQLNEVQVAEKRNEIFKIKTIDDVVETSIFAGKKSEAILLEISNKPTALNNARQIYSQVSGLNIYQNDDAGLQLNIGGRGLDPNRTSNFNTRKNGYDISADVLGYPESYYTPPAEGLERIEIIRGAASLQYGTQFGGLINFITKSPPENNKFELLTRNTIGSNNLKTNFTSIGGTSKGFSYYSFFNYKEGTGFRPNSSFSSSNIFTKIKKEITRSLSVSLEFTYLDYLAQQAGGLTDKMFLTDPYQSNRKRNWFAVNWLLFNMQIKHDISTNTTQNLSLFGLEASRDAIGFRSNRVDQIDQYIERDLINGVFRNFGLEYRILHKSNFLNYKMVSLFGTKFYQARNSSKQGPGSSEEIANFDFQNNLYPNYNNQSEYKYPNLNISFFGENIIYINEKFSITPGFRFENIDTKSEGYYKQINLDAASNPIFDTIIFENNQNKRTFFLFGIGLSHKIKKDHELYANASQNYRSVTFADISIINPAYVINPEIQDENGYSLDLGIRGNILRNIYYDITSFQLIYKDRIGFIQKIQDDGNIKAERGNVGDANILGLETLIDFNLRDLIPKNFKCSYYINSSFTESSYIRSESNGIKGNKVELIPKINLKSGISFGYKSFISNIQYTYVSEQFTDATNSIEGDISGIIGKIPEYEIVDLSILYKFKKYKIEFGINNLLNKSYFTRRSTGYPGPGIIPSPPRNYHITLELNL
jgi:Fe(3+) dicitrate transport protein